jgi:hypothetical protein
MTKLTDPAADLVKALAEKWKDKPEKDLKEAGKAAKQAEKDAIRAARVKAWKKPKTKKDRDALRAERMADWEARR